MAGIDFFDRIYVINLNRRTDRWRHISEELNKIGVLHRATRISAIDAPGAAGCFESHLKTIRTAIDERAMSPLILEDDALFRSNWAMNLDHAVQQLPGNWDMLYLGYSLDPIADEAKAIDFHGPNLLALPKGCFTTHAYCIKHASLKDILQELLAIQSNRCRAPGDINLQIDQAYLMLAPRHAVYGVYPMAVTQRDGYSDIWLEQRRYNLQDNIDNILKSLGRKPA